MTIEYLIRIYFQDRLKFVGKISVSLSVMAEFSFPLKLGRGLSNLKNIHLESDLL